MCLYVNEDVILCKATVRDRESAGVNQDFTGKIVKNVSLYQAVNMVDAMFHLSAYVTKDGMAFFVMNVSI